MHKRLNLIAPAIAASLTMILLMSPGHLPVAFAADPGADESAVSGEVAISALGDRIDDVAAAHAMKSEQLERALRDDPSLHLDGSGRLLYVEPLPAAVEAEAPADMPASVAAIPLESTFTLHSLPGATKTIYLDFDGHTLTGSAWNAGLGIPDPYQCPAYDTDGSPTTFGDAERRAIQEVWQRVSEDYLPFGVDVTTELPAADAFVRTSTADQTYGTRVLISPIGRLFDPDAGGRAYIGVFNRVNYERYKPALVYSDRFYNANQMAEAVSHEAGHNLYLVHDGELDREYHPGDGRGWGPIMGAPYGSPLVQWSNGAYPGATSTQDDLAVIAWAGPGYRADDHANVTSVATTMTAGASATATGIIEQNADVDVLRFVTSGTDTVTLTASPAAVGPNLTVLLELLDPSGLALYSARSNSLLTTPTNAVIKAGTLPAGTYYARISGVANGDPLSDNATDYGSLGAWSLTVSRSRPVVLQPVYRFYNGSLGTHFYTASATEKAVVQATLSRIYRFEGESYRLNPAANAALLYRFYKNSTGTHFYTASAREKADVQANLSHIYTYEGTAYNVSTAPAAGRLTVYRFFHTGNGTHFYTASITERNDVIANLSHIYRYEGPAFFVGQ